MVPIPDDFSFDHCGSQYVYGRGTVHRLGQLLADHGLERALVVTGTHVGSNEEVMTPVRRGLGDRVAAVFDQTTPEKLADTAYDGIEVMRDVDPDVLIGLGGGSSLDIARQMSVFAADGRSLAAFRDAALAGDPEPPDPDEPPTPVVVVPTTFAGADVSSGGSIEVLSAGDSPSGQPVRVSGSVSPIAMIYDPDLFDTTPFGPLAGSAMNGFDKGIETLYARDATPITDATAIRGLRFLTDALPRLGDDPGAMDRAVAGIVLVQFERRTSIVHAFGHGFSYRYDLQQGVAHAVIVPHVLRYLFRKVDARRELLADGLGVDDSGMSDDQLAEAIVTEVEAVRDALDLPTRLRDLDGVAADHLPAIAEFVLDDRGMARVPTGLDPTADDLEGILRNAW